MQSLSRLDQQVTGFLYRLLPHNHFVDAVAAFLSLRGYSLAVWIVLFIFVVIVEDKRHHHFFWSFVLSAGATMVLVQFVLKNFFQRARPAAGLGCPTDYGFPSGHAAVAFAAAAVLSTYDKKRTWIYYLIATLIAFSRIYLGCHYLSDVLAGAFVGFAVAQMVLRIFKQKRFIFHHDQHTKVS